MKILKKILALAIILGMFGQATINTFADLKSSKTDLILKIKGGDKIVKKIDIFFKNITDKQGQILRKKIDKINFNAIELSKNDLKFNEKIRKRQIILNYINEKLNEKGFKSKPNVSILTLTTEGEDIFKNKLSDSDNKKVNAELIKIQNNILNYGVDSFEKILGEFEKYTNYEEKGNFRASLNINQKLFGKLKAELNLDDYITKKSGFDESVKTKVRALIDGDIKGKEIKLNTSAVIDYILKDQNYYLLLEKFNITDKKGVEEMESFFEKAKELASKNKYIHFEDKNTKRIIGQIKQLTPKKFLTEGKKIASKPLFRAYKKEGNKYYLVPSKYGCDTAKTLAQKFDPFNGNTCTESQYQDLLDDIADSKIEFYIDFSGKNTEIGFDAKGADKNIDINEGKIIFSDKYIEEIKYTIKPDQTKYLGDGGSIEYIRNKYLKGFLKIKKENIDITFDSKLDRNNNFSKINSNIIADKFTANLKLENKEISGKYNLEEGSLKVVGLISGKTDFKNRLSKLKISHQMIDSNLNLLIIGDYDNGKSNLTINSSTKGEKLYFNIGGKIRHGVLTEGNLQLLLKAKDSTYDYNTYEKIYSGDYKKIIDGKIELKNKKITGSTSIFKNNKEILKIINTGKSEKDLFELNTKIKFAENPTMLYYYGTGSTEKIDANINLKTDTRGNKNNGNIYIDVNLDYKKIFELELDNKSIKTYKKINIEKPAEKNIIEIEEAIGNPKLY